MQWWGWLLIGLVVLIVFLFVYMLMAASGDYDRRCEEAEFRRQQDYERRKWEQQKKMDEQNYIPEQKRDDSSWF